MPRMRKVDLGCPVRSELKEKAVAIGAAPVPNLGELRKGLLSRSRALKAVELRQQAIYTICKQ